MNVLQLLKNVIDGGNNGVPETSQLLRVTKFCDNSLCVEARPSLDLPFEKHSVSVVRCQGTCGNVSAVCETPVPAAEASPAMQAIEVATEPAVATEAAAEVAATPAGETVAADVQQQHRRRNR